MALPESLVIEDMQLWHLPAVLKLETQIQQFGDASNLKRQREELIRSFVRYRDLNQAVCRVMEIHESEVIGYYILLTHPARVATFWKEARRTRDTAYLAQIVMEPAWQSRGLGSIMLKNAEEAAASRGLNSVILEVMRNSNAHSWYCHNTYEEVGAQVYLKKALI